MTGDNLKFPESSAHTAGKHSPKSQNLGLNPRVYQIFSWEKEKPPKVKDRGPIAHITTESTESECLLYLSMD